MDLRKDEKKHSGKYSIIIDRETHKKIKTLAFQEGSNNKEIVIKAIDLYRKATIFDHLT